MAIKSTANMSAIIKEKYADVIREELEQLRVDLNRSAFGQESKRYELHYNKCHEHGLEHKWGKGEVLKGGTCWQCEGEGLASGEDTSLWEDCPTCSGRGYEFTRYFRQCERCGFGDIRPGYGMQ